MNKRKGCLNWNLENRKTVTAVFLMKVKFKFNQLQFKGYHEKEAIQLEGNHPPPRAVHRQ